MPLKPKPMADEQMTIEEFLAFTEDRPDDEKWELIEGVPVMSPSPTDVHQLIVGNIIASLWQLAVANEATWLVMPARVRAFPYRRTACRSRMFS